jgi:hypothetical protein
VIVYYGQNWESFGHAATIVRRDLNSCKQLLLLDSKNTLPIVYPKRLPSQDVTHDAFDGEQDIEGNYYFRWELYALVKHPVNKDEHSKIHACMM